MRMLRALALVLLAGALVPTAAQAARAEAERLRETAWNLV